MSHVSSESSGKGGSQDFDLNLAPIIDCLVVLIAFMLASATFLSIGILDAGIAAGGAEAKTATLPSINVELKLEAGYELKLSVSGKVSRKITLSPASSTKPEWNEGAITNELADLKAKYPDLAGLTIEAGNNVEYADVIRVMEISRKTVPNVMLGGF